MDDFGFVPADAGQPTATAPTAQQPQQVASHQDLGFVPEEGSETSNAIPHQGLGETVKAGLEGAASAIAPFGISQGLEQLYGGVKPEDILARQEQHPIAHGVGQAAGLIGSTLTGVGAAPLMEGAGAAAAGITGLAQPVSYAARVGSSIVKNAAEMAVLQGSDETAKMVLNDPKTSAESALANVGLAAALGGGAGAFFTGAVSPLWKATLGPRIESVFGNLISKTGGLEGSEAVQTANTLEQQTGVQIPDVLKAKIDNVPFTSSVADDLATNNTMAGKAVAKQVDEFKDNVRGKIAEVLTGKADFKPREEDLYRSAHEVGQDVMADVKKEVSEQTKLYENANVKLDGSALTEGNKALTKDALAKYILENNLHKGQDPVGLNLVNDISEKLGLQDTAADLKTWITKLNKTHPYGKETYSTARDLGRILGESLDRSRTEQLRALNTTPEMIDSAIQEYQGIRQGYRETMKKFDTLDKYLHLGHYDGAVGFAKALENKISTDSKGFLKALSGDLHVEALDALKTVSPSAFEKVRQFQAEKLIRSATKDGVLDTTKFASKLNDLQPQVRDLIATPEMQQQLNSLTKLGESARIKGSATDRLSDAIVDKAATPLSIVAMLMGHGADAILAQLGKLGFKEGKDGLKLAMLKFLASKDPVNAEGFQAMAKMLDSTYKGQNMISQGVKSLFDKGARVVATQNMPVQADREKLDKQIDKVTKDPSHFMQNEGGPMGHYLQDHQMAMTESTSRQLQYLQSLKPHPIKPSPLDPAIEATPMQLARYNRALDIAENPMVVMQHVKDGTIQSTDIQDLKAMYPAVFTDIATKVSNEMTNMHAGEIQIPYKTRLGLSLFLGQPLDSTMAPQAIQQAQISAKGGAEKAQQAPAQQSKGGSTKHSTTNLGKANKTYQTPLQGSEADRANRD